MTSPNDKQTLLSWLLWAHFWAGFSPCSPFAVPPVILSGVRKHKAKNPRFHFVDTSLRSVWQGFCLPQRACALAVMRLDRHGFANKFLIWWNYNTIFHFCGRNLQIFSKKCYEKSQKGASKAENKGWGGGLLSFCEIFWGFVWVWGIFLGLLNFWALFGMCWEIFLEFV